MKKELSLKEKLRSLVLAAVIMFLGLLIFKILPMFIWGKNIRFDASLHLVIAIFVLYILWYFIDQNKNFRIPYLIFSFAVIVIISLQRIVVNAHNDIGLLLGLIIGIVAIIFSRWDYFKNKFDF